ncbi:MAG: GntR family transcriptional regulator [Geminicoccaceae bacterium]
MAALEGIGGALVARRLTETDRQQLLEAHEACAGKVADADAYCYANERSHRVLYAACHNGYLVEQAGQLRDRLKPYRRLQLRARSRVVASLSEHQAVVDAVLAGDSERALRAHILIQGDRLSDFIAMFSAAAVA